jgi:HPt (histidine-containing phosphotransfer) domain-containing protein
MRLRLQTIGEALDSLEAGRLEEELRLKAAHDAHKLAGSLGTFGLAASSASSSRIEILLTEGTSTEGLIADLRSLVESIDRDISNK